MSCLLVVNPVHDGARVDEVHEFLVTDTGASIGNRSEGDGGWQVHGEMRSRNGSKGTTCRENYCRNIASKSIP